MTTRQLNELLDPLVTGGWLTPEDLPQVNRAWTLDPDVRAAFAAQAEAEGRRRKEVHALIRSIGPEREGAGG
jgi:hypothetical protein